MDQSASRLEGVDQSDGFIATVALKHRQESMGMAAGSDQQERLARQGNAVARKRRQRLPRASRQRRRCRPNSRG